MHQDGTLHSDNPQGDTLIDHYRQTHANGLYGNTSVKYIRYIRPWITLRKPQSILDYGCGQSIFLDVLELEECIQRWRYDPAIEAFTKKPKQPTDLLINIDVLEHIEEEDLDPILEDIRSSCNDAILIIDTVPAVRTLPDGRNVHRTIKPAAWWHEKLLRFFDEIEPIKTTRRSRAGFKTWHSSPKEKRAYRMLRVKEDARHYYNFLRGRGHPFRDASSIR